ncbi:flavin monoamine oxidase family protein [Tenacibaculum agarivorans]|uniref:flavin monoamine oxidase family protein n=1 Tax=Tenacibaculum agarivorans TaxID=1908389 RepID=UPI0009FAFD25|nr:FAD-dependent oxidoreductase [Tenacibaculum agarivorans]
MTRKEFIKICSLLGISIPFKSVFATPKQSFFNSLKSSKFKGKVLIIGTGAAGLTAAYRLSQLGVDFQILEASSTYGGRMKTTNDFVDFPIPLGAEWLHIERSIFHEITNNPKVNLNFKTTPYKSGDYGLYDGEEVSMDDMGFGIDQKFIGFSWLDFYKQYILPSVKDQIKYNQIIRSIDYSSDTIIAKTSKDIFTADKIIITTPVKMLQNNSITFIPKLPDDKQEAIRDVTVWDGFKAFIEFSEKFYPTVTEFNVSGQKMYYDASYGQKSNRNVLGVFAVGPVTLPFLKLPDSKIINYILEELDEIFSGKASKSYIKHISQNWSNEPFIKGAYVYDEESWRTIKTLGKSINNKLFFAGTAYTEGDDWGGVHSAARSAIRSVNEILD